MPIEQVHRSEAVSKAQFHDCLREWLVHTNEIFVGPEGLSYKGTPWIYVNEGPQLFVLHADTQREAVGQYLELVSQYGDGIEWVLAESKRGKMTAVVYGPEGLRLTSFYLYRA